MKRTATIWVLFVIAIGVSLLFGRACPSEVVPFYDSYQAPIPKSPHPDDAGIYIVQEKSLYSDIPDSDRRSGGREARRDRDRNRHLFSRLREFIERFRARRAERRGET